MDAFAVAIATGFAIKNVKVRHALKVGLFFGMFQAIMPVFGWYAGYAAKNILQSVDHWIAFAVLSIIGLKMIAETKEIEESEKEDNQLRFIALLILAIATSIDALAVGFSLSLLKIQIITPSLIIGIITFLFSYSGVYIGNKFGHFFENKIEIIGGIILLFIGIKTLVEHLLKQ